MDTQTLIPTVIGLITVVGLVSIIISFFESDEPQYKFITNKKVFKKDNHDKDQDNYLEQSDAVLIDNDFYTDEL